MKEIRDLMFEVEKKLDNINITLLKIHGALIGIFIVICFMLLG